LKLLGRERRDLGVENAAPAGRRRCGAGSRESIVLYLPADVVALATLSAVWIIGQ